MTDLERSIIATLAYFGTFGWPLTLLEVFERLIPADRFGGIASPSSIRDIQVSLLELCGKKIVVTEFGFFGLTSLSPGAFHGRLVREKECVQKWRHMLRWAWLLQGVPFVRALYASGSLALGNTGPESDWDMFVVGRAGRLYTTRAFLLSITKLMGKLRTKKDAIASNRFCFNHYIADNALKMPHQSLYTAHAFAPLIPVWDPSNTLGILWKENAEWMAVYGAHGHAGGFLRRCVRHSYILRAMAWAGEFLLRGDVGDWVERRLSTWQIARIQREPATHESGGRVTAQKDEIEFHPRSFERVALERYHRELEYHGFGQYREVDSGLTK